MVLEGRKDLPANNLVEFIALLKQNGKTMQYGSAGVGSTTHLACALLNASIGIDVTHVPYRGGGPAANDLIGGHIDYMCGNLGTTIQRATAKQSKPLALLSRERTPLMPELATAHEQGIRDFDVVTWTAFFLPKGAPRDIVARLNAATHAAMDTPAIKTRFDAIGIVGVAPERRGPEYLARYVSEEIARWEGPIKAAGLQVD
jgi:tripartite-type tricarboxylate transporter receptor subunit TctC